MRDAPPAATVSVTLPPALTALFPGAPMSLALEAADIGAVLDGLEARWPGMRDRLCDSRPAIRRHIQLFVDGSRAGLGTRLRPGSDVVFLTAVSGG